MKLLIISNMSHYQRGREIFGWGPTVNEINALSEIFESIRHIGCLHDGNVPSNALPYQSDRITFVPLPPAGGNNISSKIDILKKAPAYVKTILKELSTVDVVHIRCPANIGLIAIMILFFIRYPKLRWAKYAGSWQSYSEEPLSYKLQRWLLGLNFHRGLVTINGSWAGQAHHVHTFTNPCLTFQEIVEGREAAKGKNLSQPVRLIFMGAAMENKGVDLLMRIVKSLTQKSVDATLDFLGDGPEIMHLKRTASESGLNRQIRFHGWIPRTKIGTYLKSAHFILLPSRAEGWPKVLSEAMAYGVVPLASRVGSIPEILSAIGSGRTFSCGDVEGYVCAIRDYLNHLDQWKKESDRCVLASKDFSYERYLENIREFFNL